MARFSVTFFFLLSLLTYSLGAAADSPAAVPASAASSAAAPVLLTPEQARQALIVLDDPKQRSRVEDTLRAVAAAGALATPAPTPAPAPAPVPASSPAAASASAASGVTAAFKSNGLVTQLSHQVTRWTKSIARETKHSTVALLDFSSIRAWWGAHVSTPEQRAQLLNIGWIVLATLVPALVLEWLVAWPLLKLRRKIGARANAAAAALADAVLTPAQRAQAHDEQIAAALTGGEAGVRQPLAKTRIATVKLHAVRHWALFRRLPAALLNFVLAALPLIALVFATALLLSMLTEEDSVADHIVLALLDVYLFCSGTLLIVDLFVEPHAPGLRLRRISDAAAALSQRWMRRIVIVAGIGVALAEALKPLGLSDDGEAIIMRLAMLVVHVMIAILIVECRRQIGGWLRRSTASRKSLSSLGNLLAEIWLGAALILVFALWLVWALDIGDGVETLLHLGGLSVAVLIVARVSAIIAFGALSHLFGASHGDDTPAVADETSTAAPGEPVEPPEEPSIVRRRAYRYYPMAQQFVTAVLGVVTALILLDIWGVHLLRFLTASQIGHRLMSALVTISIAAVVAVLIWEAVNISFERRLRIWTDRGEFVRASRLRTLMPMLRSTLLVAIGLIVGLTGLSQIGVNTAPLLAGASIFGVALGFGSQKLVQDFITGIFLLMENAMQVGDWVTVAGVSGSVEYLSIRTVRLRGSDGSLFTVPFSSVTTVNNVNRGIGNASVRISIAFGADVERAVALLKSIGEELRNDPEFKDGILSDFSFWGVDALDGAAVTLAGQIQCRDSMRWPVQREFNRRILMRFTAEGIDIANPLRNVMVPPARAASAPQAEAAPDTSNPGGVANTVGPAGAAGTPAGPGDSAKR
jgi:small-conductance mechanosensitive channel